MLEAKQKLCSWIRKSVIQLWSYIKKNYRTIAKDLCILALTVAIFYLFRSEIYIIFMVQVSMHLLKKSYRDSNITNAYMAKTVAMSFVYVFIYAFSLCSPAGICLKLVYALNAKYILEYKL